MNPRLIPLMKTPRWLWALGLGLTFQFASAQNASEPGNAAIPAARPATGNATAPAQARPATPAPAPATAAPKTTEPAKTPPAAANTVAAPKPAAATPKPPTPPVAAEQAGSGDTSPEPSPNKKAGAEPPPCIVADFRAISIDTQDAEKRRARALSWIARRGKQCTAQQLLVMRNNRSQWLGTGDSGAAAAAIDALLEGFAADNPDIALLLYGTPPPPPPPPDPKAKPAPGR